MVVKSGRFGDYVTDGEYNATLRKDDTVEAITLERAAELLAERRAKGPAKKAAKRGAKKHRQEDGEEDGQEDGAKKTTKKAAAKKLDASSAGKSTDLLVLRCRRMTSRSPSHPPRPARRRLRRSRSARRPRPRTSAPFAGAPSILKPLPPQWFVDFGTNAEMRWDSVVPAAFLTSQDRLFVRDHVATPDHRRRRRTGCRSSVTG